MKAKNVIWIVTGIVAVCAIAAGVALFVNRYLLRNDDSKYIECDCSEDEIVVE